MSQTHRCELNVDRVIHLNLLAHIRQPREVVPAACLEDIAKLEGTAEILLGNHDDVLEGRHSVRLEFAR